MAEGTFPAARNTTDDASGGRIEIGSADRPILPRRSRRRVSPLTMRILLLNLMPLLILVGGVLYLDRYEQRLIATEFDSLALQGELMAAALGEGAIESDPIEERRLSPTGARQLLRRLTQSTPARARVFAADGELIADSRALRGPGGTVEVEYLPPPTPRHPVEEFFETLYDNLFLWWPRQDRHPVYREPAFPRVEHYEEARWALRGETETMTRVTESGVLFLSIGVPIQNLKQVLGALLLSVQAGWIDDAVRSVRFDILKVFGIALAVTVLLSLYLANAIARPIRRLALAAERVRLSRDRRATIPDFGGRGDEIGDLSVALREMTDALSSRLDAIERFAADVAHEIKNPLTSVQSAVETASRIEDSEQRHRLMTIVLDDVRRLDRLISDISSASRLDAELGRAEFAPVDVGRMLTLLVEIHEATRPDPAGPDGRPILSLSVETGESLVVLGIESRLVQVFRNLIANAVSFSPAGGAINMTIASDSHGLAIAIDDEGPGIPEGKLEAIFDRFYSERPKGEKFGTHSGLGLSISKQIVDAHHGKIHAENRRSADGRTIGARFVVRLPKR